MVLVCWDIGVFQILMESGIHSFGGSFARSGSDSIGPETFSAVFAWFAWEIVVVYFSLRVYGWLNLGGYGLLEHGIEGEQYSTGRLGGRLCSFPLKYLSTM